MQFKVINQYNDKDIDRSYLHIRIDEAEKINSSTKPLTEFYYPNTFIEGGQEQHCYKQAIEDIKKKLNYYLELPKLEEASPETIYMYEEFLQSDELVVYVDFETDEERQEVFEKLKEDIQTEHYDKFELYEESEILLYADFITLFNIANINIALDKMNQFFKDRDIVDDEGLET